MFYLIIFIILALITFSLIWIRDKLSKIILTIYLIWWGTWLSISVFNVYDLFPVSESTYLILILNVVMFYTGFLFSGISKKNNIKSHSISIDDKFFKHSLFSLLLVLTTISLFYFWYKNRSVLQTMDPVNARLQRFNVGALFSSKFELYFFNYFIESFIYVVVIILAFMIVYGKILNFNFVLSTLSVFLYGGIGSGRGTLMDVIIAVGLIYLIRKIEHPDNKINQNFNKAFLSRKVKILSSFFILLTSLLAFIYSAWLTALRVGYHEFNLEAITFGMNKFLNQCVVYYTGPFRALEYGLKFYPQQVGFLLGRGTFAGLDELVNTAFNLLGIKYESANEIMGNLLQNYIQVGQNQTFNFAYTSLMIHYFDFGIFGIIIFPFLYGFFIRKAIFNYESKPVLPNLVIIGLLFNTMINTIFKWGLQSPPSIIALIGLYIWYRFKYKRVLKVQEKAQELYNVKII